MSVSNGLSFRETGSVDFDLWTAISTTIKSYRRAVFDSGNKKLSQTVHKALRDSCSSYCPCVCAAYWCFSALTTLFVYVFLAVSFLWNICKAKQHCGCPQKDIARATDLRDLLWSIFSTNYDERSLYELVGNYLGLPEAKKGESNCFWIIMPWYFLWDDLINKVLDDLEKWASFGKAAFDALKKLLAKLLMASYPAAFGACVPDTIAFLSS